MSYIVKHQPMEVARVGGEHNSIIEPALEKSWSELERLRWHTGVLLVDHGVTVNIVTGCYGERNWRGQIKWRDDIYGFDIGPSFHSAYSFPEAETFLAGVGAGAAAVRREML